MKRIILLFMIALALAGTSQAQFRDRSNVVLFGGYLQETENRQNVGEFSGLYLDYLAIKSPGNGWSLGPYAIASQSSFYDEPGNYYGHNWEAGAGAVLGYYNSLNGLWQIFAGSSLGLKYAWDNGSAQADFGDYLGRQRDLFLYGNLNFNLLKGGAAPLLLPRTQLVLTFQKPIYSYKEAYWKGQAISSEVWNKSYFEAIIRQSLLNIKMGKLGGLFMSPKAVGLYSYSLGNRETCFGFGGEISLHRPYKDDFLALYGLYKIGSLKNVIVIGANLNIASIFLK